MISKGRVPSPDEEADMSRCRHPFKGPMCPAHLNAMKDAERLLNDHGYIVMQRVTPEQEALNDW